MRGAGQQGDPAVGGADEPGGNLSADDPTGDPLSGAPRRRPRQVPVVVHTVRTGPQEMATVEAQGVGPGAASASDPVGPVRRDTVVLPSPSPLRDVPLPIRLRGLTGAHGSRRPGEGGDLRDVHLFHPGDRLRRIDWRVTAHRSPGLGVSDSAYESFYGQGGTTVLITVGLYLVPFAGIAFLWHMTAFLLAVLALWQLGFGTQQDSTARWWIERPLWFVAPGLILLALVAIFGRFERPRRPATAPG